MTEGVEPTIDLQDLLRPDEQRRFRRLCLATSPEELGQLTTVIDMHLDHIRRDAGPTTDVETAEMIGDALGRLLRSEIDFDAEARAQIRGAVEYFLLTDDAAGDLEDVLGFDDDARVVNTVLNRIGHSEFAVDLPT
ncbi:MAG: hypothetical protein WBM50_22090 [Acidimicrobiales bacterium]